MEKPIYVQPSIDLSKTKRINYNKACLAELKAWEAAQTKETE